MARVWGRANSVNVQKVMWAAAEVGLEVERIDVGGAFGGLDTPDYGAMNPNRRIPVLEDGGASLWESNAIVRYLAARYGAGSLWPDDPVVRARADAWMDWQVTTLLADMTVVFWNLIRMSESERDQAAVDAAAERLGPPWAVLDDHLRERPFVAGNGLTMGDIPVAAMVHRYLNLPLDRPSLPRIEAYYRRLQDRPGYRDHVMLPVT